MASRHWLDGDLMCRCESNQDKLNCGLPPGVRCGSLTPKNSPGEGG